MNDAHASELLARIEYLTERLARVESRLVQLMLHLGLDPQKKHY